MSIFALPQDTPSAPPVLGPYSHVVRVSDLLIFSGQLGIDPATGSLVSGGTEAQARQILANIAAMLEDCGGSMPVVAKATIFLTDLGDFAAVNAVYAEAFGDHKPARTTIQVAALPAGASIEIEILANLPIGTKGASFLSQIAQPPQKFFGKR